jgi:aryl-phospho-beta-D-glucosidase BglC (GH1 family)
MVSTRREFAAASAAAVIFPKKNSKKAAKGFVRAQGKELIDPDGKPLLLRGINLGNWLEPEGYMFLFDDGPQSPREIEAFFNELVGPTEAAAFWQDYRKRFITEADIRFIQQTGLNSVRIPFHYKFFVSGDDGFRWLDAAIEWCDKAGLWVILDMHCAPGGQTGTNIDDSWGYPWLFESEEAQDTTCQVWKRIAEHYRDEPAVIGYDLLNEPIPHFPRLQKYNSKLEPLYKRITRAIREVDQNHLVILGGAQWDTNFQVFGSPFDSKSLYQFHKYWMEPNEDAIREYLNFRERYNVPVWLGESGENTDQWVQRFVQVLEKNNVGWCFWPYKKMEKTSCLVSVAQPAHWDEITAFAKMPGGTGAAEKHIAARPSLENSREALHDLLQKIEFSSCSANRGYLTALGLH